MAALIYPKPTSKTKLSLTPFFILLMRPLLAVPPAPITRSECNLITTVLKWNNTNFGSNELNYLPGKIWTTMSFIFAIFNLMLSTTKLKIYLFQRIQLWMSWFTQWTFWPLLNPITNPINKKFENLYRP